MAKNEKPRTIDVFEITFTRRTPNENKKIHDIFEAELNRKEKHNTETSDIYKACDFTYNREGKYYSGILVNNKNYNMPVASKRSNETFRDLPIEKDESLGFMTCFIYDVKSQIIFIERMKDGVTMDRFFDFLNSEHNLPGKLKKANVLDPLVFKNFEKLAKVRKFKIEVARVTDGTIFSSSESNVRQIIDIGNDTDADSIVLELSSYGKSNFLSLRKIKHWVSVLKGFNNGVQQVNKLVLTGKDEDDNPIDPIDMVNEVMKRTIKIDIERNNNLPAAKKRLRILEILFLEERQALLDSYSKSEDE